MRGLISLVVVSALVTSASNGMDAGPGRASVDRPAVEPGFSRTLTSTSTAALAAREVAGPDTFVLYGGPEHPTEGKFQLANGTSRDWGGGNGLPGGYGGGPDAWSPVDVTEEPVYWHQSTFNAENLNNNGTGNNAFWCGVAAGDPLAEGWGSPPGLGNSWFEYAVYESEALADPAVGQVVDLEFFFNYDLFDETWDFFRVQYDSAGTWITVLEVTGTSPDGYGVFPPPGKLFSDYQTAPISYVGNDYGGPLGDRIRIRLLVTSDGAWSDEDGNAPSAAGATQIDDITLTTSQGTFTEDFEGPGPYLFVPHQEPFAGDFADVYARLTDIDPCRENPTPVVGFIDYGQVIRNGPGVNVDVSTGGSLNPAVSYGIPGNWVVSGFGGLSGDEVKLRNEVWSPVISWDASGPDDDAAEFRGAQLSFDVWSDLPFGDPWIFYYWQVRSGAPGQDMSGWVSDNRIFRRTNAEWHRHTIDLTAYLTNDWNPFAGTPDRIQVALGVWDVTDLFGYPSGAGRPSPCFDNVTVRKYRLQGPVISLTEDVLFQDGFPVSGSVDVTTQAARDALDVPIDSARDITYADHVILPGDSLVIRIESGIQQSWVQDARIVWALKTNPLFEGEIRAAPSRPEDENVVAGSPGTIWTGEVVLEEFDPCEAAIPRCTPAYFPWRGAPPDVDFMYPGDVLHYYIQATDDGGRTSTLPADLTGFGDFAPDTTWDRGFTVRGIPSIEDATGAQPRLLVVNDHGQRGGEAEFTSAFGQIGYREGVEYDTYTVRVPLDRESNGIGSAGGHGATAGQLEGYETIIYLTGDLSQGLLSNGSDVRPNDKSDDISVLEDWADLPGNRNIVYFGNHIARGLTSDSASGAAYLSSRMGVAYVEDDVRPAIENQVAPMVIPSDSGPASFQGVFVAAGGCPQYRAFDHIRPFGGSTIGHDFADRAGNPLQGAQVGAGSVLSPTTHGLSVTFPFSMAHVSSVASRSVGLSARATLFAELLDLFGAPTGGVPTAVPDAFDVQLTVAPNPFNPITTVNFTAAPGSRGTVQVFNLRGELVATLHSGEFQTQEFRWEGTDSRGAPVSSGVYLIRAADGSVIQTQKVALVK